MAGLLSDVLPFIYSQGDRAKRAIGSLLSDPLGSMEQTEGGLLDAHREQQGLLSKAMSDPKRPFAVTDRAAMQAAAEKMLYGPLGMAPAGMVAPALRPALMLKDGEVLAGEPGRTHLSIFATSPRNLNGKIKDSGFVGADGQYLTRDQAEAIANLGAGPLDAAQYGRSLRGQ